MVTAAGIVGRLPVWAEMAARRWQEGPDLRLARHLVDPSRAFVDVGANAGLYAWAAARRGARVLAVEPHPAMATRLRERLSGVEVVEVALSDEQGTATLHVPRAGRDEVTTRSTLEPDANRGMDQVPVEVAVRPLDDVVDEVGLDVGFLKVDVEGHEHRVLGGAGRTLDRDRPVVLMEVEWRHHGDRASALLARLTDRGYDGHYLHGGSVRPLASFDPAVLQTDAALKAPGLSLPGRGAPYVNNFFFVHAEDAVGQRRLRDWAP